eukprot:m.264194 g.264194  ORF g.264194 m.264194 type:complete len:53 (+) comp56337_c0_seq1:160-318(+)
MIDRWLFFNLFLFQFQSLFVFVIAVVLILLVCCFFLNFFVQVIWLACAAHNY